MKKFFAEVFLLLMICASASAMRLELEPQPLGKIFLNRDRYEIDGAKKIKGNSLKGCALFDSDFKFYFCFDRAKKISRFGDRDKKNSVNVDTDGETEIYRVANTAGCDLFLLNKLSNTGSEVKVVGLRGGKWIEQLDANTLREKYDIGWNFYMTKFFTVDNKIIFRYELQNHSVDVICRYHAVNEKFYTELAE